MFSSIDAYRRAFALSVAYKDCQRLFLPDLWNLAFPPSAYGSGTVGHYVRCLEGVDLSSIPIKYVYGSRLD